MTYILLATTLAIISVIALRYALPNSIKYKIFDRRKAKRKNTLSAVLSINEKTAKLDSPDASTDLPTRNVFDARLKANLKFSKKNNTILSIMAIDIDGLREFSSKYGDGVANNVILQLVTRLKAALKQSDTLSKYVANRFFIIMPTLEHKDEAIAVAQQIQDSASQPFMIDAKQVRLSVSVGIATFLSGEETCSNLIKNAERALNEAKSSGGNTYRIHISEDKDVTKDNLNKIYNGKDYLNKLTLKYQPYQDLIHPKRRIVQASLFVADHNLNSVPFESASRAAEASEKSYSICSWQIAKISHHINEWKENGFEPDNIVITIPLSQLLNHEFINEAYSIFDKSAIANNKVVFNVINSQHMASNQRMEDCLQAFSQTGMSLSLSILVLGKLSVNQVEKLPIKFLKIDRQLVDDLQSHAENESIITSLVANINNTDIQTIADDINYDHQMTQLNKIGCCIMRGKMFSDALSAEEFLQGQTQTLKATETA